jgi:hypothetical protein
MPSGTIKQTFSGDPGPLLRAIKQIETAVDKLNKSYGQMATKAGASEKKQVEAADKSAKALHKQIDALERLNKTIRSTSASQIRAIRKTRQFNTEQDKFRKSTDRATFSFKKFTVGLSGIFTVQTGISAFVGLLRDAVTESERLASHSKDIAGVLGQLNQLGTLDSSHELVKFLGQRGASDNARELGEAAFQLQSNSSFTSKDHEAAARIGAAGLVPDLSDAIRAVSLVDRSALDSGGERAGFSRTFAVLNEAATSLDFNLGQFSQAVAKAQEGGVAGGFVLEETTAGVQTLSQQLGLRPDTASERFRGFGRAVAKKGIDTDLTLVQTLQQLQKSMDASGKDAYSFFGNENAAAAFVGLTKTPGALAGNIGTLQGAGGKDLEARLQAAEGQGSISANALVNAAKFSKDSAGLEVGVRAGLREAISSNTTALDRVLGRSNSGTNINEAVRGFFRFGANFADRGTGLGRKFSEIESEVDGTSVLDPHLSANLSPEDRQEANRLLDEIRKGIVKLDDSRERSGLSRIHNNLPERKEQ